MRLSSIKEKWGHLKYKFECTVLGHYSFMASCGSRQKWSIFNIIENVWRQKCLDRIYRMYTYDLGLLKRNILKILTQNKVKAFCMSKVVDTKYIIGFTCPLQEQMIKWEIAYEDHWSKSKTNTTFIILGCWTNMKAMMV